MDALGGEIGKMADRTYLQKRVLNSSRGPAVWALRAQTDKREYAAVMGQIIENQENLAVREGMVTDIVLGQNEDVIGVQTYFGVAFRCKTVILTTGTFLGGGDLGRQQIHVRRTGWGVRGPGFNGNLAKIGL